MRITLALIVLFSALLSGCAVYVPPVSVGGGVFVPGHGHGQYSQHGHNDDN